MAGLKQVLSDAQTLAEFANIEPAAADHFRRKHPEFVPSGWWDYRAGEQWRMTQRFLRESWDEHFEGGAFFLCRLILSVFDPKDLADFDYFNSESASGQGEQSGRQKAFAQFDDIQWGETPFQRAVMHLFENPWRARFCPVCNKRFVAAEPKSKFCSESCSHEATRRRHNAWARKNRVGHAAYMKVWQRERKSNKKMQGRREHAVGPKRRRKTH